MDYQSCIQFLFEQLPMYQRQGASAYKKNLHNTISLLKYLGNPEKLLKTIHVAGTNGKGSVSHLLASVFQEHGYKTGLHTSPHLQDFRERIKINGLLCSKDFVVNFVNQHQAYILELKPSFFELTVAMAFVYFKEEKTDIAIIEVGMGGRLDSTNIIEPELAIITNIGFDHQAFLGDTLEEIAGEKAGIIKENTPTVIGLTQKETHSVFSNKAAEKNSTIHWADKQVMAQNIKQKKSGFEAEFIIANEQYAIDFPLNGLYQVENVKTFILAAHLLKTKFSFQNELISKATKNFHTKTGLRGRWESLHQNPTVFAEVAHNQMGLEALMNELKTLSYKQVHIVFGMVNDKDINPILDLLPHNYLYYFTQARIPRALASDELYEAASAKKINGSPFSEVKIALDKAMDLCKKDELILITGSIFIVAEALDYFDKT